MPTNIRQIDDADAKLTRFEISGEMNYRDAVVLERLVGRCTSPVLIDVAPLSLLDSEAASVLRKLAALEGVRIEGMETFLQTAIDSAERSG